jgi:toxin ParE1/3/4
MKRRDVVLSPEALTDIDNIFDAIARAVGNAVADGFCTRLENYLSGFDLASERGTLRSDIRPNLRIVGFERRITIAFSVTAKNVTIIRIFWGGQNWSDTLEN